MSYAFKVASVGPVSLNFIFDPIDRELRAHGHEVIHYTEYSKLDPAFARDVDALVAISDFPCTREMMSNAPRLRAVVCPFIGTEGFDEPAATDLGIVVANGQVPENFLSMAEATIMLILASLYDLHWWERQLRENLPHPPRVPGCMLRGKTVGLIGFGKIGRAVASRLSTWDVILQIYTPRLRSSIPPQVARASLEELLKTSDVVCVLANLNAETRNLLSLDRLRLMKPTALLINTARGAIVDEAALVQVARERPDFRIALDTFAAEPLPHDSPLRDLPNAILTPHAIGHTQESLDALPLAAVESVRRVLKGELPRYVRNPEVISAWTQRWRQGR